MNLREWIEKKCEANGSKIAIVFNEQEINYNQLDLNTNKVANLLLGLGLQKGDKIGLLLSNYPEFVYILYGAGKVGIISACIATTFRGESLAYLINSSDSTILIVDNEFKEALESIKGMLPKLKKIIWFPELPEGRFSDNSSFEETFAHLFFQAQESPPPLIELNLADPFVFLHSSGTTGRPKWIIQSANFVIQQGQIFADFAGIVPNDRIYNPLPLYHGNPQGFLVSSSLYANATMIIGKRFSASSFWEEVKKHKATCFILHFSPIEFLKKQPRVKGETDHSVRVYFPADYDFMERFKIPMGISGYGSIDIGMICYEKFRLPFTEEYLPDMRKKLTTVVGFPLRELEIAIVGEDDRILESDEPGEIVVRPLKPHLTSEGYYHMSEKTLQTFRNFWFHTGDVGYLDREGRLHYSHRLAESINVKGEWVDVPGLEDLIRSYPKIMDCVAVGIKDAVTGEEIKVYVQPKSHIKVTANEIIDYCEGKIAYYMIPRYIEIFEELPRLAGTEKVARADLAARGIGDCWDREKAGYKLRKK